ncbi:MAG: heliorhodopsin HeR [Ilumatobacter sp.]|uniref:heliorhodopsin HeR n=1 Tax=Ilumatobacter sp. TaxID=1967498 RepID=UPI0026236E05|nr:heliorhodopsin HeR [Ilumatobacter sp.]MDJ0768023.1 heliorhodopsin HeR [Ilumatobacter sp.]
MSRPTTTAALRRWNVGVGVAHLLQAIVLLVLSNDFAIPVEARVQDGPPGTPLTIDKVFFDLRFSVAIAVFLLFAAVDHLAMAAPRVVGWYESNLAKSINPARWAEYSVSASIMIVLIAMLPGVTNLYALIGLFSVNAAMILFGWLMERVNRPGEPVTWWPFVFGCVVGVVPWVAITIALITSQQEGDGVPGFVYGIFVSLFVLFNCFALNQWLQYRGKGRFADYLYGEKVYLVLSLVAKSALAWQVYAGTLAD